MKKKVPIVKEISIIKTYSEKQQERVKEYFRLVKFKSSDLTCSQISKFFDIKLDRVHRWLCKDVKPYSVHAIEICKSHNWLPLYPSPALARLVGLNMGDGGIQTVLLHIFFCSKYKEIVDGINNFIFRNFGIKGSVNPAGFDNNEYILEISNTAFTRLLYCAGCPKGEKTKQTFNVPHWIRDPKKYGCTDMESKEIQLAFLQGLNDSETTKFSLRGKRKMALEEIKFEIYTQRFPKQLNFIKQLQKLFRNFSIKTVIFYGWRENLRSWRIGLRIKELPNIMKFLFNVGFFFNKGRMGVSLNNCYGICKKRFENIEKCITAMEMVDSGQSYGKVSRSLKIPISTVFNWKSVGRRPLYFNRKEELQELFKRFEV